MAAVAIIWIGVMLILPIFVGNKIGNKKNRAGWAYGLLLGWLGVIILACLSVKGAKTDKELAAKQREIDEIEADLKLEELRKKRAALTVVPDDQPAIAEEASDVS